MSRSAKACGDARTCRETGQRDLRWTVAALGVWGGTLLGTSVRACHGMPGWAAALILALAACAGMAMVPVRGRTCAYLGTMLVGCAALLAGMCAMLAHANRIDADPLMRATQEGAAAVDLRVTLTTPPQATTMADTACKAYGTVHDTIQGSVHAPSGIEVLLLLPQEPCTHVDQGMRLDVHGQARRSPYDGTALWVSVQDVGTIRQAAWWWRAVHWVRARFLAQTATLGPEGRILVPGVTLGILGQDVPGAPAAQVDPALAAQLEEQCRNAGILHLMAVSGGHYALLGTVVRALGAWLRTPWKVTALLRLPLAGCLTMLLIPSQSVARAATASIIVTGFEWFGRPPQTLHVLALSAIACLLEDPSRAVHQGFALSCASVLGIGLFAGRLEGVLGHALPRAIARPLAVSVAAQGCTMPIQLLMDPAVPLWALPANLVVGPCMDLATVGGLLACVCGIPCPWLGSCLARVSEVGTQGIAMVARTFGSAQGTVAWASGWQGIATMAALELAAVAAAWCLALLARAMRALAPDRDFRHAAAPMRRLARWASQTRTVWADARWERPTAHRGRHSTP